MKSASFSLYREDFTSYWVSFLDGTQRVLLFTDEESLASAASSTSQLEKVCKCNYCQVEDFGFAFF